MPVTGGSLDQVRPWFDDSSTITWRPPAALAFSVAVHSFPSVPNAAEGSASGVSAPVPRYSPIWPGVEGE